MTFNAISWVKGLNGLRNELLFSYHRYEKMRKLAVVDKRKVEDNISKFVSTYFLYYLLCVVLLYN